ncbi:hypothetical protein Bca52824_080455 [Brassica carinata]|uniref:Uncharacterized protein n=1 Tax=Brassica carinata TaxID=52824 RepID=A0A8X7TQN0_BRACI|nr:hypothetical protein Bca52824_080455 [Brassica carinata]
MRCRNWKGSAKISYEDIITIESNFASTGDVFPSISTSGNFKDVITDAEFVRVCEMKDERVDLIIDMQRNKYDWSKHVWAYKETVKPFQYSSEEDGSDEEAAVETSETEIEEEIESTRVSPTKKRKNRFRDTGASRGRRGLAPSRSAASAPYRSRASATAHNGGPANAAKTRSQTKDADLSDVFGSLFSTLDVNIGTQEYLQKTMGNLTQESNVDGFDPSQDKQSKDLLISLTPMTSFRHRSSKHLS